jgi:hypothetical protein
MPATTFLSLSLEGERCLSALCSRYSLSLLSLALAREGKSEAADVASSREMFCQLCFAPLPAPCLSNLSLHSRER